MKRYLTILTLCISLITNADTIRPIKYSPSSPSIPTTTSINTNSPLNGGGLLINNPTIGINQANGGSDGYLSASHWNLFNSKLTSINGRTAPDQFLTISNIGNNINISSIANTHTFNIPNASSVNTGRLLNTDWNIFNNKLGTLNGLNGSSQTFTTGTTGTDFNITSSGSIHTFNIPDTSNTARGLININSQNIAGVKTFTNAPVFSSIIAGRVLFTGTGGVLSNNANFVYDNTNSRLGLGTATPLTTLDTSGSGAIRSRTCAISTNTTLDGTCQFIYVNTSSGNVNITMYPVANNGIPVSIIKTVSANLLTITAPTNTIDGNGTTRNFSLATTGMIINSDGANYRTMARLGGSFTPVQTITAGITINNSHSIILGNTTAGAITQNLPIASTMTGQLLTFKKTTSDINTLSIVANGAELIDGINSQILTLSNQAISIISTGSNWAIISKN
jgi:hypothetical protein